VLGEKLDKVGDRDLTLDEIEDLVEETGREMDRWVQDLLITEQTPPASNRAVCPECGAPARYKQTLETELLTIHGRQAVIGRHYRCENCGHGFSPLYAVLGVEKGRRASRRVRAWLAKYGADEASFASVPPILSDLRGLEVSESTVERTTVEVGLAVAEANRTQAAAPPAGVPAEAGAEKVYLAMDGTMCPLREPWRKNGVLGKLVCRYGEAKVGMAFTTGQKEGLDTGILTRECVATLGKIAPFTRLMRWLARRWGADRAGELIVLGDGAAWIWALVRKHFPHAVEIVDYWHILEHLWKIAELRFGARTAEPAKTWIGAMRSLLEQDLVETVIADLERWEPRSRKHRAKRDKEAAFLRANRERLRYKTFLAKGYLLK
jgi:transposase